MTDADLVGKIQTVLGVQDANSIGIALPHEHLLSDMSPYFEEPTEASEKGLAYQPLKLENLSWNRVNPTKNVDNLKLTDENMAIKEALLYKWAGGNSIVEVSSVGLSRDPLGLARIARATGLNIIMGSGYYIGASHPPELANKSVEEIADEIVGDIVVGVRDTGVRAGIIGEIGCSLPLEEAERKVLRASAIAQRRTGAAITVHPSFSDDLVLEIVEVLRDAGANLTRTIICHNDLFGFSLETQRQLAKAGCYLEYDNFGHTAYPHLYQGLLLELVGDLPRIDNIMKLIDEGYLNQILMSHDVCFKDCLTAYGGYGYAHILRNVYSIMKIKGISEEQFRTIVMENPKKALQFVSKEEG